MVADATLTRTGIFVYYNEDGTERRELRTPEEVFKKDSLDSLKGAPLTVDHPGLVTPDNWKKYAVGHIGDDVRQDGAFVRATVYVQDAKACSVVKSGKVELSCGYDVSLNDTPGDYEGGRYDAVQTHIRYNHTALVDRGRAGSDVRLRLDGKGDQVTDSAVISPASTPLGMDEATKALLAKVEAERDAAKAEAEKQTARADSLQAELDKAKSARKDAEDKLPGLLVAALKLREDARVVLGADADLAGKTDRQILEAVIKKESPALKMDGLSDTYLQVRFDIACENARKDENEESLSEVRRAATGTTEEITREDSSDEPSAWSAREKMMEANRKAFEKGGK
jgi:hypothetical protein